MFKIEKNIPITSIKTTKNFQSKYPFNKMEIGDSFFIPEKTKKDEKKRKGLYCSAKRFGIKIATRKGEGGLRVWKVGEASTEIKGEINE